MENTTPNTTGHRMENATCSGVQWMRCAPEKNQAQASIIAKIAGQRTNATAQTTPMLSFTPEPRHHQPASAR